MFVGLKKTFSPSGGRQIKILWENNEKGERQDFQIDPDDLPILKAIFTPKYLGGLKRFLTYLFLFLFGNSFGQNPAHFVLGADEFANTDIYTLLYDNAADILYIGSDHGLYAYKQNRFVEVTRAPEQIGTSLFQLQKDSKGDIFCCNLSGQVFRVGENRLILFHQAPKEAIGIGFEFFFDGNGNLLTSTGNGIRKVGPGGESSLLFQGQGSLEQLARPRKLHNGDIYFPFKGVNKALRYRQGQLKEVTADLQMEEDDYLRALSLEDEEFFFSNHGQFFSLSGNLHSSVPKLLREDLFYIGDHEIVALGGQKGGRILKLRNDSLIVAQSFFPDLFLAGACANAYGTLFIGTFGEGVIVIPRKEVLKAEYDHLFLGIAVSPDNQAYLSTRAGQIFRHYKALELLDQRASNVDRLHYLKSDFQLSGISEPHLLFDTKEVERINNKDVCVVNDTTILFARIVGASLLTSNRSVPPGLKHFGPSPSGALQLVQGQRCRSVTWMEKDSLVYYSSNFGVFQRGWSDLESREIKWQGGSFLGTDLETHQGQLICGTAEKGILIFEDGEGIRQIGTEEGLKANTIEKLLVKGDRLFILSKGGMQIYNLKTAQFIGLGMAEGMTSNKIANFALSEDRLWLMEKHAYFSIPLDEIPSDIKMGKLYLDSILVNGRRIDHHAQQQFSHRENAVDIFLDYRSIETVAETKIQYQLEGFFEGWKDLPAHETMINFQSLPVGAYTLEIKATYRGQSSSSHTWAFEIVPPYWQRWWFYVLIGLAAMVIIWLVARQRIKNLRRKNAQRVRQQEVEKNAIDAQLRALRAQMNPHFIFNSLNSIQDLVLRQETMKSYDSLVIFSRLVRNTLDYSDREFISLTEEIEFLETYLSLEKLRFRDDFNYELTGELDAKIQIPSLIIQPFLENAIKHGLMHQAGAKELKVHFRIGEKLTCEVTDNGVGREESDRIKREQGKSHRSFSTGAIRQRMEMLSSQWNTEVHYQTVDLKDEQGNARGTKVVITLPFSHDKAIP